MHLFHTRGTKKTTDATVNVVATFMCAVLGNTFC
jgi:hypothetical protein